MDQMDKELELANYQGEDRVLPLTEVVEIYRRDNPQGEPLQSKLATLDKTIGGFFPGQLIVISGPTGMGKTTFSQTVTIALMEQMAFPLWFSFEVDCLDFARVFPHDATKFVYVPAKLKETAPVWIEDKIIEAKMKYDVKAVFIDHLHYLVSMNPKQNQSYMIGNTVRGLKQLALKHKVVMFLIAHMQKTQNDEEPGLGQIRDSSFVEQESDTVLYCWRPPADRTITIVKVAKNRKRGIMDVKIELTLQGGRYFEQEKRYGEE
jgi:twinkle protein